VMDEGRNLIALARAFRGRRCLVVGDAMLDVFERGRADRLAPDAPAPVVTDVLRTSSPGGAANVAANLAALGARVTLLSVVGDDDPGLELLEKLQAGVETGGVVREAGRATVVKRRLVADGVTLARVDSGDTGPLRDADGFAERAYALAAGSEAVVVSDYAGGTVTQGLADALDGSAHGCVVLDSKSPLRLSWRGLAAATPNHLEAQKALEIPVEADPRRVDYAGVGRSLHRWLGARTVAVTLAEQGVAVAGPGGAVEHVAGRRVEEPDVNGAGDTFLAAFALALSGGASAGDAARLGVKAATLAVRRAGTAPVGADELLRHLSGDAGDVHGTGDLQKDVKRVRNRGGKVVFTSGRFDPPHRGHLRLLQEARELGDSLVVGLLPDAEGARGSAGASLPIEDRAEILKGLCFVDHVVLLEGEGPEEAARRLGPDLFVVQGNVDASAFDGEVVVLEEPSPNGTERRSAGTTADDGDASTESPAGARL
ncbi:MAG: PfkB family carbohydrate kinase, partial [Actinomycetota bacterium]|nr:PfkB family carbohydrate kinase [Actinomycetota bacterium]